MWRLDLPPDRMVTGEKQISKVLGYQRAKRANLGKISLSSLGCTKKLSGHAADKWVKIVMCREHITI